MPEGWRVPSDGTWSDCQTGRNFSYYVDVYRFVMDIDEKDVHLQTEETDGYKFATADEIRELGEAGKFLHYDSIRRAFE